MINRGNARRVAIALVVGGGLLVSYPAVSGGLWWDLAAACGYVCVILFVCLYVFPVRGEGLPHARLLGLTQHKFVGWCVLGAAVAHAVLLLVAEPQSYRYLLPSAPVFMWCGVIALLSVIASAYTGLSTRSRMRRASGGQPHTGHPRAHASAAGGTLPQSRMRQGPEGNAYGARLATIHIVLAGGLVVAVVAHIIGSGQLLGGLTHAVPAVLLSRGGAGAAGASLQVGGAGDALQVAAAVKIGVVLVLLTLPLGWYALRRRPARQVVRAVSHVVAIAIIALIPTPLSRQLLLEPVAHPAIIAVNFPHESHMSVNCVTCHHNYIDHAGTTPCIECHRSNRTDLGRSAESTFHTFCRDCHTQLALEGHKRGPTRSCSGCHQGIRSNNL